MTNTLKALSLWQPWGSLWLSPNKRHETRHWKTSHRGRLLVHAAKRIEKDVDSQLDDILSSEFGNHWGIELPTGAIIGVVNLIGVIPTEQLYVGPDDAAQWRTDIVCGDFSSGRYGWRRGSYWRFPDPIPYRGRQMLFDVPRDVVAAQIEAAVEVRDAA
jgi:hypothetical protein